MVLKQIPKNKNIAPGFIPNEIKFHALATKAAPEMVAQLYEWYDRGGNYVLVMEYPEDSLDLFQISQKYGAINVTSIQSIMYQVVFTSLKLRAAGIIHHDIKDENILVNPNTLKCKFIDFGCAKERSQDIVSILFFLI